MCDCGLVCHARSASIIQRCRVVSLGSGTLGNRHGQGSGALHCSVNITCQKKGICAGRDLHSLCRRLGQQQIPAAGRHREQVSSPKQGSTPSTRASMFRALLLLASAAATTNDGVSYEADTLEEMEAILGRQPPGKTCAVSAKIRRRSAARTDIGQQSSPPPRRRRCRQAERTFEPASAGIKAASSSGEAAAPGRQAATAGRSEAAASQHGASKC